MEVSRLRQVKVVGCMCIYINKNLYMKIYYFNLSEQCDNYFLSSKISKMSSVARTW